MKKHQGNIAAVPAQCAETGTTRRIEGTKSGGFSMLELVVAMSILGIALAGIFPLAIQYSRQVGKLEDCNPQAGRWNYAKNENQTDSLGKYPEQWYLNPPLDSWAQKLGAAALLSSDPSSAATTAPEPIYDSTTKTIIADDSSSGYYDEGDADWLSGPTSGYLGNSRRHLSAGTTASTATSTYTAWTFKNVSPGWYVVEVTWPDPNDDPKPERNGTAESPTASAYYAILANDAGGSRQTLWGGACDQSVKLTADNADAMFGAYWLPIQTVYVCKQSSGTATTNTVEVRLMSQAQDSNGTAQPGFTTADAVLLVPVINVVSVQSLARSLDGNSVSAGTTTVTTLRPRP